MLRRKIGEDAAMYVVITGGAGFLGRELARALLERRTLTAPSGTQEEIDRIVLFDAAGAPPAWADSRVELVIGDIADRQAVAALCDRDDISVFHLASVLSGGGEADFDLALSVNVDGGRNVLEALRATPGAPRLVFASSLAVFGGLARGGIVGDATKQAPETTYGATKAILELLVNDYTHKGFVDGRTARLPTVIVRPGAPNSAASSFASTVVRERARGVDVVVPVPGDTRIVVIGHRTAIACLVALHEHDGAAFGTDRSVQLPGISVSVDELIDSTNRLAGGRRLGSVTFDPDPDVIRIVQSWPASTACEGATSLGLPSDADTDSIVAAYLEDFAS
jgi:nucleoside-diphosphate-sugar epimerase